MGGSLSLKTSSLYCISQINVITRPPQLSSVQDTLWWEDTFLVSLYSSLTTKLRFSKVQSLNGWLKPVGIGAFHCAVQASHKFMGVENGGLGGTKVKKMLWTITGVEDTWKHLRNEWIYPTLGPMYKSYPWFQISRSMVLNGAMVDG